MEIPYRFGEGAQNGKDCAHRADDGTEDQEADENVDSDVNNECNEDGYNDQGRHSRAEASTRIGF